MEELRMNLLAIQRLGRNRDTPRLWIESQRLSRLGFAPGTPLAVEGRADSLVLTPAILGENHVSSRLVAGSRRPIIDLASHSLLDGLAQFSDVKIIASFERIQVTPSQRAFAIQRSRSLHPPFRVLEAFSGGGTMTAALSPDSRFAVVAGIEIEPDFADEWQGKHPESLLVQADIRSLHTTELPEFDVLIGGIPCTSHSNLGRAKKSLAGKPESGDTGDLFLPVLTLISERMPAAVVLENVPAFGTSLAGQLVVTHLERIGYHVGVSILQPNADWGEIEDRKRWLLVATLDRPFALRVQSERCAAQVSDYLDPPDDELDQAEADRIARTIEGLRAHNARHRAAGHGFEFTVVEGTETRLPVIPKSYHKINTGPFVQTPFGPRLLRQAELERIHGCQLTTRHYATAVQILGQGVQTRLFRRIFNQLAAHLA
jgi:DNA (cytosine-5)-methyltransferase 1